MPARSRVPCATASSVGAARPPLMSPPPGCSRAWEPYAAAGHAHVISRGLLGSRLGVPVVISPMLKHTFELRTGRSLDEPHASDGAPADLRVWPVRVVTASAAEVC
ncbi:nitrite reductase (NAD(P)H) small subunit [Streptomyces sp. NPDC059218]|uniref:nitrite reductase (NAD(P)H) small subunit n=1 Tax=unclassified Streptomyces TaxID=2593676 RepID=UPI0036AE37E2